MILEDSGLPYMYIKLLISYFSRKKVHICQQFLKVLEIGWWGWRHGESSKNYVLKVSNGVILVLLEWQLLRGLNRRR